MKVDLIRVSSTHFSVPENPEKITSLRAWHCKYKSLKAIGQLVNLRELVIASFPDDSLDCLSELKKLEYLKILHLPKVRQITGLAELDSLISLSLSTTPGWDGSGKRTVIDTLEPLSALPTLKHIELLSVIPEDRELTPLLSTPNLEIARFGGYPAKIVEHFYAMTRARPDAFPHSSFE